MKLTPIYEPYLPLKYKLAVVRQLMSGWIGPGPRVTEFEGALSKRFGGRECIVAGSGTQALMLAYMALDLPVGATIACPAYGFPACQNAARMLGYNVQLIDVRPETGCMDPAVLDSYLRLRNTCRVVVFVDHNGYTGSDLERVGILCQQAGVHLIEDASVALGCKNAGMVGTISTLSFSVPKVVTAGQGGAVITKRPDLAAKLRQLVDQGGGDWRKTRVHSGVGGNFRMTDLQAALGAAQVDDLDTILSKRADVWSWYRDEIELGCDVYPSGWMATYRARDAAHAETVMKAVHSVGFDCKRLYCPVYKNTPYSDSETKYPGTTALYERLLYLPSSIALSQKHVVKICNAIKRAS